MRINIKLMKSITKLEAGGFYIIQSKASANSNYFEKDGLASLFFKYFNYYLKDYMDLYEYSLNQDGWIMAIRIKSRKTIKKQYQEIIHNRKKKDSDNDKKEIWRIISERMRIFISTYVRLSNKLLGREGSLVKRKYERYRFENHQEAIKYIHDLRNQEIDISQPKSKYQGNRKHSTLKRNKKSKDLLHSSYLLNKFRKNGNFKKKIKEFFGAGMSIIKGYSSLVVLKNGITPPPPHPAHSIYPDSP